ncbi:MAG TPA: hypothetical protein DEF34_07665 [Desulfotomaculum sp.]|nr:hypothetical protein [Desulfotomaculum sp.]
MINKKPLILLAGLLFITAFLGVWWLFAENKIPVEQDASNGTPGYNNSGNDSNNQAPETSDHNLYTVELTHLLNDQERTALLKLVDWAGEYNGNTLPVRANSEQAAALESLPFVKSIGTYEPVRKIAGNISAENNKDGVDTSSRVEIVVTLVSPGDNIEFVHLVDSLGGSVAGDITEQGRYLKAEVPADAVGKLAASSLVLHLEKYHQPELLNDRAKDITGASPLAIPSFFTQTGLTGRGVMVGIADSGLDTGEIGDLHPDLRNQTGKTPRVVMLQSWAEVDEPADTIGHGTHMAGTIAGSGAASDGKYAGVAPESMLYFQGIVDQNNNPAPPLDLSRLYLPAYEAGVRVHVNGWGRNNNLYSSASAQIDEFVRRHSDFLPIFGAGNSGPRDGSLTAEANSKNALVVGASLSPRPAFDNDGGNTRQTAEFSSRGPAADGRIKPDLIAPGTSIISTSSSLVDGNLSGRPEYTRMQGTSMASAITGGAAALLKEYLEQHTEYGAATAALLKAVLINGAQAPQDEPHQAGFGVLDIGSTVLALEKGMFNIHEEKTGLRNGESSSLTFEVTEPEAPVKITLVWTDPAATPGSGRTLVNNLDLAVVDPNGERLLGNDFSNSGQPDTVNNVEQVVIPEPVVGTYRVEVYGRSIKGLGSASRSVARQDFALVYGQQPSRQVLGAVEDDFFVLNDGNLLNKPENLLTARDGALTDEEPQPGADLYFAYPPDGLAEALAVSNSWQASGIKVLMAEEGPLLVRINRQYREGGYFVDNNKGNKVEFNGDIIDNAVGILPGSSVTAAVNPQTQTLWRVKATSREATGVVGKYDVDKREILLLGTDEPYEIAPEAALAFNDSVTGDPADLPFGAPVNAGFEHILPGMPVKLTLGPDGSAYHVSVERQVLVGTVASVDALHTKITLSSGKSYTLLADSIKIDGRESTLRQLQTGEFVMGVLVPGSQNVLNLNVYSNTFYGRVDFAGQKDLYLVNHQNTNHIFAMNPATEIYRWGISSDSSILAPGQWVRVVLDASAEVIQRVDIAEVAREGQARIKSIDKARGKLYTSSGEEYALPGHCLVTKNGYPVLSDDLQTGDIIDITVLRGAEGSRVLARVKAYNNEAAEEVALSVHSTIPFDDFYLLSGRTSADKLYAWHGDGSYNRVELTDDGEFFYPAYFVNGGDIQLVGVGGAEKVVTGLPIKIPGRGGSIFSDIDGHWAEADITNLASKGLLSGYGDRTFRPGRDVSRVEFAAMVARLLGKQADGGPGLKFKDAEQIPDWAVQPLRVVAGYGLVSGYDDGTFRPHEPISRVEAAAILVRTAGILNISADGSENKAAYRDNNNIPMWARQDVILAGRSGLLVGKPDNLFKPADNITRAETAVVMQRLLDLAVLYNKQALTAD